MYSYDYPNTITNNFNNIDYNTIWFYVAIALAIVIGVSLYFLFVRNNKKEEKKEIAWIKDFLDFHHMIIEDLLKIVYIVSAIFITLYSIGFIGSNFPYFIVTLILGNALLRLGFEGILIIIMIWKNTTEINKKMKK